MKDYASMSDFEINKSVAIALDIDMHFYIPESDDSFQSGFLPTELGPIWQTSARFVGEFTVSNGNVFNPCNNPADAWPIISENKISTMWMTSEKEWCAWAEGDLEEGTWCWENVPDFYHCGESQLRAAMIVFLMMKDGE